MKRIKVLVRERWFQLSVVLVLLSISIVVEFVHLIQSSNSFPSTEVVTSSSKTTKENEVDAEEIITSENLSSTKWNKDLFTLIRESDSVIYLFGAKGR